MKVDGDGDDDDDGDIEVTCVKDREMRGWLLGGGGDVCWRGGCRSVGSQPSFSSGNNASDTGNTQRNDDLTNKLNTEHNLHFSVPSEMSVAVTCQILQRCDLTVRGQVGGGLWTHRGRKGQVVAASSSRWLRFSTKVPDSAHLWLFYNRCSEGTFSWTCALKCSDHSEIW